MPRDCAQQGHVWLEPDGTLYARHRDRPQGSTVAVSCLYCEATTTVVAHGRSTAPPRNDDAARGLARLTKGDDVLLARVAALRSASAPVKIS